MPERGSVFDWGQEERASGTGWEWLRGFVSLGGRGESAEGAAWRSYRRWSGWEGRVVDARMLQLGQYDGHHRLLGRPRLWEADQVRGFQTRVRIPCHRTGLPYQMSMWRSCMYWHMLVVAWMDLFK